LLAEVDGLADAVKQLTSDERAEVVASAVEFILEGLHLNRRLNCERSSAGYLYRR
jgi:magnesium chelatase subunit I